MSATPDHNSATVETAPPFFSGRLAAAYILQFLFIGLYTPFFPVWLEYQALTPIEISTVLAFPLLVRVLATVPMMWVADYHPDRAKLFSMLYTLAMLAMMGFLAAGGFWEILIISFIFHFFSMDCCRYLMQLHYRESAVSMQIMAASGYGVQLPSFSPIWAAVGLLPTFRLPRYFGR